MLSFDPLPLPKIWFFGRPAFGILKTSTTEREEENGRVRVLGGRMLHHQLRDRQWHPHAALGLRLGRLAAGLPRVDSHHRYLALTRLSSTTPIFL